MQPHTESNADLINIDSNISNPNTRSSIKSLEIANSVTLKRFQNYPISLENVSKLMQS